ncbi:MAG: SixA phosphatase family protein [Acidimicrobiales bacterium]
MRQLFLIRHGKAADRQGYPGPDSERPLTSKGEQQSALLVDEIASSGTAPERLLSSPALRCRQTIAPLAERLGLPVEVVEWLDEGSDPAGVLDRVHHLGDGQGARFIAACSHGDVIWGVLESLAHQGVALGKRPDAQKASTWVIEWGEAAGEAAPVRAAYLPPPEVHTDAG